MQQADFSRISEGDSVSMYLIPDETNPNITETEVYEESFQLPHVFQSADAVVGLTQKQHITHVHGRGLTQQAGFFYTSYGVYGVLSSYDLNTALAGKTSLVGNILPASDYATYDFKFTADFYDIWDYRRGDDIAVLVEAIRNGHSFRAVTEKKDGTRQVSAIEMPYFWPDFDVVQFQTKVEFFPSELLDTARIVPALSQRGYPLGPDAKPARNMVFNNVASTYLSLFTDGRYYSLGQVSSGNYLEYENLTILCNQKV